MTADAVTTDASTPSESHRPRTPQLPKPKNALGRDLPTAVGVGVGLGAVALLCIFVIPYGWYGLVAIAVWIATGEVTRRMHQAGMVLPTWVMLLGGQVMVWSTLPFGPNGLVAAYVATVLAAALYRLFHRGSDNAPKNYLRDISVTIFVLTWVPVFASFAAMLYIIDDKGPLYVVTFLLAVIASDVGGYAAGVMFGSHPMAPHISPKKSWEGFGGSLALGIGVSVLCAWLLLGFAPWVGVVYGAGAVACATAGDLIESQVKRDLKIKDMGTLLPGHGGLMDRIDGMLPAAMITWLVISAWAVSM